MSLAGRLFNVFATPGDVFQEVATGPPSTANWLVPALLSLVISWLSVWLIFSQDSIQHQLSEMTERALHPQLESGRMSEQQFEQSVKMAGFFQKAMGIAGPLFAAFLSPFWWGLILWLVGSKAMKGGFPFMKAVEAAGLSNMISVLDGIIRTLMIVGMGDLFASPSLSLLVHPFDPQNTVHSLLALVNVMTFWVLTVRAVGVAKLSGGSLAKALAWVFGIWIGYNGFFIGLGLGFKALMKHVTG